MAKRRKRNQTISDAVRQAIDECGESRYSISQATGIDQSALSKFYNGHRGIYSETLDRLGEYLGLRIVVEPTKKKGK